MAKKKTSNGINLLKGITGSKLAKLAMLVVIVLAIPLTVVMSRQQQNTQQNAGTSACQNMGGSCMNTDFQNNVSRCQASGKQILKGLCPGAASIQCCVKITKPTVAPKKTCGDLKGKCLDLNKYTCTISVSGLCPGASSIKCCTGNFYRK